jgi:hypothetical protein
LGKWTTLVRLVWAWSSCSFRQRGGGDVGTGETDACSVDDDRDREEMNDEGDVVKKEGGKRSAGPRGDAGTKSSGGGEE